MAQRSEGYSGSDIAIVVREALMEPLRKCQSARQFVVDTQGNYHPCVDYPNCPHCPMVLSSLTADQLNHTQDPCVHCHAHRMSLYDVPSELLIVPRISFDDFHKALNKAHSSVGGDELRRFVSWTEEFGQEG
jgi:vacuolar protein-sorting-associated protein 4